MIAANTRKGDINHKASVMATRSHTTTFIQLRNSNVSRLENFRHWNASNAYDDEEKLVDDIDVEYGNLNAMSSDRLSASLPPEWVDIMEEVQYTVTRVQQRMKDLSVLHDKHSERPRLDDNMEEEHAIEIITAEITQMFHNCQREIQKIGVISKSAGSKSEQSVCKNVMSSLAKSLQSLSADFRSQQSRYLKVMRSREEKERAFFDTRVCSVDGLRGGVLSNSPATLQTSVIGEDDLDFYNDKGFVDEQMTELHDNSELISQREQEINKIAQSLLDVQTIFKDLAGLIIDQGTILDRIDYNVERVGITVEEGVEELMKGEKYQKKSRKMLCILVLLVLVIGMIFLFAFGKKKK